MGAVIGVWSNGGQRTGSRKSKKLGKHPSPLLLQINLTYSDPGINTSINSEKASM
jgi:hypothetical protein